MILTIGDSVCWGQGLVDEHKFDRIYAAGADLNRVAHSGAILGSESDNSTQAEYPEVPVSYPSVWQQVSSVADWADAELVILNGGINDVSLTRILSPWVSVEQIEQLTQQFCLAEMLRLLSHTAGKLVKPEARIAVLGYYPILSPLTRFDDIKQAQILMESHGVAISSVALGMQPDVTPLIPAMVNNCMAFWTASTNHLKSAVAQTNGALGREVCVFVASPLTEANSLWAPEAQLWQLNAALDAEDEAEIKTLRDRACESLYGDVVDLFTWIKCDRASLGHPNVAGAARIATALTSGL